MAPSSTKQQLKSAKALIDSADFAGALSLLDALLSSNPSNYHAHVLRGVALRSTSEVSDAIAAYSKAVALRPETPLAHKGLIDAILETDEDPAHRALLAKAHAAIGGSGITKGAKIMYELALADEAYVDDAVEILGKAREAVDEAGENHKLQQHPSWCLVRLLAGRLPDDSAARKQALLTAECSLSAALDDVERMIRRSAIPVVRDAVRELCEERVVLRCAAGGNVDEELELLKNSGSHEALLELSETSAGSFIPASEVVIAAYKALHVYPVTRGGRARFVFAAERAHMGDDPAIAETLAGLGAVKAGMKVIEPGSCTQALVVALLRLQRTENKLALEAARAGQRVAAEAADRERYAALLGLLAAAALAGDRKYKDAIKEYGKARAFAQKEGDKWIEKAANRGIVDTAVAGHGRKSRQASIAVEEAAGSAENDYGVLECAWTDSLSDDLDSARMADVTLRVIEKAKSGNAGDLGWEFHILAPRFIMSNAELAAVASTRLGQVLIKEHGPEPSILARAQKCHMEAANLFKGLPDPFAHLGWIFEKLARHGEEKKMSIRAIRCYEKALSLDAAHPVASRRLTHVLIRKGCTDDATTVAREAADRNPKARWAHNIVGWSRLSKSSYIEASLSFRNALRGRPKLSARAEEALFGTDVGFTEDDNDLVVDVDSWRGLSAAYQQQGKVGPAVACMNDAIALLHKPPLVYVTTGVTDIARLQDLLGLLLESERSMLLQIDGKSEEVTHRLESVLRDSRAPLTIKSFLSEAYVFNAAKEWLSGCYSRATTLRLKAAQILETSLVELQEKRPQLNPSGILKRHGDTLMEVATHHPKQLASLVQDQQMDSILAKALRSFCTAAHYAPWDHQARGHDLATAMLAAAILRDDESLAKEAVDMLSQNQSDPSVLAMSFLALGSLTSNVAIRKTAQKLAGRVSRSVRSKSHVVALNSSIAVLASVTGDVLGGTENAISAVRHDPTDWRGWYAVASVREADARGSDWPPDMIRTSRDAYIEADRLGGGPCAVHGIVRCLNESLQVGKRSDHDVADYYRDACFCASTASRVGLQEPPICRKVIDQFRGQEEMRAKSTAQELANSESPTETYKHVHLYPWCVHV